MFFAGKMERCHLKKSCFDSKIETLNAPRRLVIWKRPVRMSDEITQWIINSLHSSHNPPNHILSNLCCKKSNLCRWAPRPLILSNPVQFTIHSSKRVIILVAIVRVLRKKQKWELTISISNAESRLSTTRITSEFVIKLYIHFLSINTRTRPHCPYGYFIAKCKTCCCAAAKCQRVFFNEKKTNVSRVNDWKFLRDNFVSLHGFL